MLNPHFIKLLVARLRQVVFSPLDHVVEEGEIGNEMYFLSEGRLRVSVQGITVTTLTRGACFGEIAVLIPGARRAASIIALTFAEAHMLVDTDLKECLTHFPMLRDRRAFQLCGCTMDYMALSHSRVYV